MQFGSLIMIFMEQVTHATSSPLYFKPSNRTQSEKVAHFVTHSSKCRLLALPTAGYIICVCVGTDCLDPDPLDLTWTAVKAPPPPPPNVSY